MFYLYFYPTGRGNPALTLSLARFLLTKAFMKTSVY